MWKSCLFAIGLMMLPGMAAADSQPALLAIEAETGAILYAENADAPWQPASLTKMMTAYLAFEAIAAGHLSLDAEIVISDHAARQSPVDWGLEAGDRLSVRQAIAAMIVASANDIAVALAERIAGSEKDFADRMSAKAQALGMARTHFANASGLPDPAQVTTARDMAILAMRLIQDYPQFYDFFAATEARIGDRRRQTVNGFLGAYPGADGLKTGFTCDSGYNLAASALHGKRRLIAILLGARSRGERIERIARLLDSAFAIEPQSRSSNVKDPPEMKTAIAMPRVMSGAECRQRQIEEGIITDAARIVGWGIVFGAFPDRDQAIATAKAMRGKLAPLIGAARPAIIAREVEGITRYSALLTGLDAEKAGAACKLLWQDSIYCLALRPEIIANPKALWR